MNEALLVDRLVGVGLKIENSTTGRIHGRDEEGNLVQLDRGTPISSLASRCVGVQLWVDDESDAYVSWSDEHSLELFVDGLERAVRVGIFNQCSDLAVQLAIEGQFETSIQID